MDSPETPQGNIYDNAQPFAFYYQPLGSELAPLVDELFLRLVNPMGSSEPLTRGNKADVRANLELALSNLFMAWQTDPSRFVQYGRTKKFYPLKGCRNPLQAKFKVVEVIDALQSLSLVEGVKGFRTQPGERGKSYRSRVRASATLQQKFAEIGHITFVRHSNAPLLVLRDKDDRSCPYKRTTEIANWESEIAAYNKLLMETSIEHGSGDATAGFSIPTYRKAVYRVFNRGSFDKGGRFYGPFWQGLKKKQRAELLINGELTVELDYEAQHLVHIYARSGINYHDRWPNVDPYQVEGVPRRVVKKFVLIGLNAKSQGSAAKALRQDDSIAEEDRHHFEDQFAFEITRDRILAKHGVLAGYFCSDLGIELQREDSEICRYVLNTLTAAQVPVLSVHDSFIVQKKHEAQLRDAMEMAYKASGAPLNGVCPRIKTRAGP